MWGQRGDPLWGPVCNPSIAQAWAMALPGNHALAGWLAGLTDRRVFPWMGPGPSLDAHGPAQAWRVAGPQDVTVATTLTVGLME